MKPAIFVFGLLFALFFSGISSAQVNPAYQCPNHPGDDCIMIGGTPCMNYYDANICIGQEYEYYGQITHLGWLSNECYCPYSLVEARCANVTCPERCNGNYAESGTCNPSTAQCEYSAKESCSNGCDSATGTCKQQNLCANVDCSKLACQGDYSMAGGYCSISTGECLYTDSKPCPNGCDLSTGDCKSAPPSQPPSQPPQQPPQQQGKCAGVSSCPDVCVNGAEYSGGDCDSQTGGCVYASANQCPGACDAAGKACAQGTGKIQGDVYITDFSYGNPTLVKRPLKGVHVSILVYGPDGRMVSFYGDAPNFFTDENGHFSYSHPTAFAPGNKLDISIDFYDEAGKLKVVDEAGSTGGYVIRKIAADDPQLSNYQIDLTDLGITASADMDAYGKAYMNTMRAIGFKEKALGLTPTTKETVTLFRSSSGTSHLGEIYSGQYSPVGMRVDAPDSSFFSINSPDNREFHEYCHHIDSEARYEQRTRSGEDHGSYDSNGDSEWGLVEGWAEYCSLQVKKYYGLGNNGLYYYSGGALNFELNHKVDENPSSKFSEELGIAGILLDLTDSASDYGGKDDDGVSLPLSTVWAAFSSKQDFQDGKGARYVHTLRDFYVAVKATAPSTSAAGIDSIFKAHDAFQDQNSNKQWDAGEPFGYSGKGGTYRSDLEPQSGSEVIFDVTDQNGNKPASGLMAHVEVRLDPPYDYLSYSYDVPVVGGKAYVPPVPEGYSGQITMAAKQGGTGSPAGSTFTISAAQARSQINPSRPLGTYTANIVTTPFSCSRNLDCKIAGAGDTCTAGVCSKSQAAPGGCLSMILLAFLPLSATVLARRN